MSYEIRTKAWQKLVWPFQICRLHLHFSGLQRRLPSKISLDIEPEAFAILGRLQHLKLFPCVFLLHRFRYSNLLGQENPRIAQTDGAYGAYEEEVLRIVVFHEDIVQGSVAYLGNLVGR